MERPKVLTAFSFDTELSADSVEWCPIPGHTDVLAVGTYQVDKSEEDQFSGSQRRGRIYIQRFRQTIEPNSESSNERAATLNLIQILETAAILDLKWSPDSKQFDSQDVPVLASADANGDVIIYGLVQRRDNDEEVSFELRQISKYSPCGDEEKLALSLDWDLKNCGQLIVSDSKGHLTVLALTSTWSLDLVFSWKGHDFEAWTSAFDLWSSSLVVFSGGDDCKLKCFDVHRTSSIACPVFVSKEHMMGVTSLLSDARNEFRLYSGSYDENLNFWDTRSMKQPVTTLPMGGGVWRIRQLDRKIDEEKGDSVGAELLAVAAMHNGFHIVNSTKREIVASYTEEHQSLAYGIDMKTNEDLAQDDPIWISSCSFYDHTLKLWSLTL